MMPDGDKTMKDCIMRKDVLSLVEFISGGYSYVEVPTTDLVNKINSIPAADAVLVGRCRDCEHFEPDHWEVINYLPMIVAHEVCTRWGKGCKTSEDGYCFLWEKKKGQADGNDGS